ncbi:hypothetical protein RRG08_031793 [Elysia crispata]|uniref:Uncharacterized protein n=1 Tax=Elysia crispata TaxID=231223 RepID=A0AAE0Y6P8_9GAST|nr:hypothetical protein RRG08_031793 [Elysia crispata]
MSGSTNWILPLYDLRFPSNRRKTSSELNTKVESRGKSALSLGGLPDLTSPDSESGSPMFFESLEQAAPQGELTVWWESATGQATGIDPASHLVNTQNLTAQIHPEPYDPKFIRNFTGRISPIALQVQIHPEPYLLKNDRARDQARIIGDRRSTSRPKLYAFRFLGKQLEEDYIQLATQVERRSSGPGEQQVGASGLPLCPVCTKAEIDVKALKPGQLPAVCVDCKKTTCPNCGAFAPPLPNKVQEWVCVVCNKRRQLMMTTGLWYHGYHGFQTEDELPLTRSLGQGDSTLTEKTDTLAAPGMDASMTSIASDRSVASSRDSRASRESREESDSALDSTKHSSTGARCGVGVGGTDSGLGLDLVSSSLSGLSAASSSNSELAKHVYEQNRMKGILMYMMGPCGPGATLPKSESDEFSDLTSDLDFDELASERSRPDGGSSTDENIREGMASHERGSRRNKHRPRFLHLTRSHSHTSSDEEEDHTQDGSKGKSDGGQEGAGESSSNSKKMKNITVPSNANSLGPHQQQGGKCLSSSSSSSSSTSSSSASYTLPQGESKAKSSVSPGQLGELAGDAGNLQDVGDGTAVNSPTPRSPSWREGLESPPFSPRRRDSYPGKRRGSLSPKEKKGGASHFTYSDISPPSRQLSLDELYGGHVSGSALDNGVAGSQAPQRPSPMSPQEIKDAAIMTTSGHALVFDLPPAARNGKQQGHQQQQIQGSSRQVGDGEIDSFENTRVHSDEPVVTCGVPHSAPVMDLATFAANITSSTNTLTSLTAGSVSPCTQQNTSSCNLSGSPEDSEDSSCSSPVSPGYYDNATPPSDEPEEVCELADPASKSIDMQGSKRQKARPPSTDWSPVIDLSPILDVSPSVEEAEQEDMLAKRMEELERQRSREAEEEEEEVDEMEKPVQHQDQASLSSKFRGKAGPMVTPLNLTSTDLPEIPRIPPPPSAKKLKQQLNEELEEAVADNGQPRSRRNSHEEDDDDEEEDEGADMSSCFTYGTSLRRCGNFEDISRLSCDNSNILTSPLDYSATDDGLYGSDTSQEFQFPSCTSQAETFSTVSSTSASTISSVGCSSSFSSSNSSSISSERDIEMLDITDQIQRITQDMENIVKKGEVVDVRPVPPPKPKRRLPDAEVGQSPPPGEKREASIVKSEERKNVSAFKETTLKGSGQKGNAWKGQESKVVDTIGKKQGEIYSQGKMAVPSIVMDSAADLGPYKDDASHAVPRQDSGDRKKAKDLKAKPSPLLITHIECEEQSVSPHYRVMESPPTPETKTVKREFSDSTSVSPSSTPDQDVYAFPSPVTPPDSDSSPPKPHSPSSPGTDFDEDDAAACRVFSPYDNSGVLKTSPQLQRKMEISESVNRDSRASAGSPDGAPVPVRPPISPRKSIRRQEEAGPRDPYIVHAPHDASSSPLYENVKGLTQHDYLQEQFKTVPDVTSSAKGIEELGMPSLCAQYIGQRTQIFAYPAVRDPHAETSNRTAEHFGAQQAPQPARSHRPEVPPRPRPGTTSGQQRHQQQPHQQLQQQQHQQKQQHQQQKQQKEQQSHQHQQEQKQQQHAAVVRQSSIKDKIKAFEEPPIPRKRFQKEATPINQSEPPNRREVGRREGHVMHDKRMDSGGSSSSSGSSSRTSSSDVSRQGDPTSDGKKVRRKLPPIPAGEDPVLAPKSRARRGKGEGEADKEAGGNRRDSGAAAAAGAKQDIRGSAAEVPGARSAALQGFIVGRSNRKTSPRGGDDAMNEEDLEVARLTTHTSQTSGRRGTSNSAAGLTSSDDASCTPARQKGYLAETGKSRSLDSVDSAYSARGVKAALGSISVGSSDGSRVKPPLKKTASLGGPGPQCETDAMIDELIEIYGIPCTEAMKCLKQRLQEELRRVTRDRKRKLEELEEIRALQMQIGALKLESDALSRTRALVGRQIEVDRNVSSSATRHGRSGGPSPGGSTSSATPKSSPQVTPRRARHKRQSSDPMVSKFSPIKEDRDIEADLSSWGLHLETIPLHGSHKTPTYPSADESSQSGISDSESTRSEPATRRYSKGKTKPQDRGSDHANRFLAPNLQTGGGSAEILSQYATPSRHHGHHHSHHHHHHQHRHRQDPGTMHLSGSRSEQHLPTSSRRGDAPPYTTHYSSDDDEESKVREEKRALLQWEITRRRRQLEETARLKEELLKLARSRHGHAQSWDDLSRQELSQQYVTPPPLRPVPRGIITPIEDGGGAVVPVRRRSRDPSRERSRSRDASRERVMGIPDEIDHPYESPSRVAHRGKATSSAAAPVEDPYNYSSSEYLAHKQEAGRRFTRGDGPVQYGSQGWIPCVYGRDGPELGAGQPAYSQPMLNSRVDSAVSLAGGGSSRREVIAQDVGGIVSSVTLPNIYSNRVERGRDFRQPYRDQTFASTSISDTDNSPASDITPAMPLLGDVKIKSRAIIRNIGSGSRPVSAEFSAGEVEDLLNAMYRVESDNSVDADEPIMKHMTEGGVTILKQIERKRRPAPVEPHRYEFPVKRILVTRDPKDKSITGNGLGMKIMGGKQIPDTGEMGAFVTAIYPILADQLHGELDIGDQVLEWNGVHLTGLSGQDVQDIIASTVGEIEMVVRAQTVPLTGNELSLLQPESCRSSYDNLTHPLYEEAVKEPPPEVKEGSPPRAQKSLSGRTAQTADRTPHASRSSARTSRQGRRQPRGTDQAVEELSPEPPATTATVSSQSNSNTQDLRQTQPTGVDPRALAAQLEGIPGAAWPADSINQSPGSSSSHRDQLTNHSSPTSSSSHHRPHHHHHNHHHHHHHHHPNSNNSNNSSCNHRRERDREDLVSPLDNSSHFDDNQSPSSSNRDVHHSPDTYQRDDLATPPATPPGSSPCSTPRSDPTSTSSDRQQRKQDKNVDNSVPERSPSRRRRRPSPQQDKAQPSAQRHHHHHHQHQHQQPQKHSQQQQSTHQRHHHQHHHHHNQQQQLQEPREDDSVRPSSPNRHQPSSRRSSTNDQQHQQQHQQQQQQQQQQHQSQQQQQQQEDLDLPPQPERAPPNRKRTERRKQGGQSPVVAQTETSKPRQTPVYDQLEQASCSSPALNDRLRASPPLDTRRSVKTRASKRGKDNFVVPPKPAQVIEKGEDFGLGEIQLQISHDDFDNTLNIHVIQARNLRPRDLNGLSDPFVKLYMLPGRGPENKRRTKHIPRTLNPEWHQTVMFQDVARLELQNKVLEITVWDYDRFKANDFLGELIIELREFAFLDNKPHWYPLKEHVTMQSFELPKSTVSPPKPSDARGAKSKSPRQGKKHGVSSLRPQESKENGVETGKRRRSLGTLTGNGPTEASTDRQVSSAHNSPVPPRRPRDNKSPIKTKSNGLLYR